MALLKQIELDSGIILNYHRIVAVTKITNHSTVLEIAGYTSKEKRIQEIQQFTNGEDITVYVDTTFIDAVYNENATIKDWYTYLKTTDRYIGAEDDEDVADDYVAQNTGVNNNSNTTSSNNSIEEELNEEDMLNDVAIEYEPVAEIAEDVVEENYNILLDDFTESNNIHEEEIYDEDVGEEEIEENVEYEEEVVEEDFGFVIEDDDDDVIFNDEEDVIDYDDIMYDEYVEWDNTTEEPTLEDSDITTNIIDGDDIQE